MRIAIAQINTSVGDLKGNTKKIISSVEKASPKADIIIFPELTIAGYPPQDLLFEREFIRKNKAMLSEIAGACTLPCVVGFIDSDNGKLYNSAAFLQDHTIVGVQHKMLLPNYDVFDERRYFTPGDHQSLFEICGTRIGIEICEDLWDLHYDISPTLTLLKMGAEIIVNISASPYCIGKLQERINIAQSHLTGTNATFVYCNLVGGQDELIFDGRSFILRRGRVEKVGKAFEEDFFIYDSQKEYPETRVEIPPLEELWSALVLGLRDYCAKTHHERVVLGLSGGIDSSLVACVAAEAVGRENVVGIFMPSLYTSPESTEDVQMVAKELGIRLITLPIDSIFDSYREVLHQSFEGLEEDVTEENIQARIRGNLLMAFSNKFNHLVLATGNKTELALGYCTLYGDMSGGLSVIGDVSKTQVYELAQYYNTARKREIIPKRVFLKAPSAELKEGQVDPFDYSKVSPLVDLIIEDRKSRNDLLNLRFKPELIDDLMRRMYSSEFKRRQAAPAIKVTKKAFGIGRRYPIANQFSFL